MTEILLPLFFLIDYSKCLNLPGGRRSMDGPKKINFKNIFSKKIKKLIIKKLNKSK
jgi:hypothetical protein